MSTVVGIARIILTLAILALSINGD